jgi:hypothetical protein
VFDASDESPQHAADRGSRATEQHDPLRSAFSQIAAPLLQVAVILEPPPPPSNSQRPLSRTAARAQFTSAAGRDYAGRATIAFRKSNRLDGT